MSLRLAGGRRPLPGRWALATVATIDTADPLRYDARVLHDLAGRSVDAALVVPASGCLWRPLHNVRVHLCDGDQEAGASPARSRHCDRGATPTATAPPGRKAG